MIEPIPVGRTGRKARVDVDFDRDVDLDGNVDGDANGRP